MTNRTHERKMKRAGRREARKLMAQMAELITESIVIERFDRYMKPKPRFMPVWLFKLLSRIVIDIPAIKNELEKESRKMDIEKKI